MMTDVVPGKKRAITRTLATVGKLNLVRQWTSTINNERSGLESLTNSVTYKHCFGLGMESIQFLVGEILVQRLDNIKTSGFIYELVISRTGACVYFAWELECTAFLVCAGIWTYHVYFL